MSETVTQPSSKIGSWTSYFGLRKPTEEVKSEEKEEGATQPQQEVTENKQEEAPKEKDADYKSLYENMQSKFDKQAKAIEISKRTAKENQKLKSQLQDSKSRVTELEQRVDIAHDNDDVNKMAELKAQIINEQHHQQELKRQEAEMRDLQESTERTTEMIETKLTGFHSLNLSSAIQQQAELMGIAPQEGAIDKLIQEPHLLGRDLVASVYLIAKKDKEIADMKKELENLKIKHSDPQMTAIQKQSNNFTYNEDYNSNNGVNPAELDKFLGTASLSDLEKHLYKRS